jgi:hypothetical protein
MRKEEYADSDLDALDEFEDKELLNLGPWDTLGDNIGLLSNSSMLGKQCRARYSPSFYRSAKKKILFFFFHVN